jgi:hypothetical protein
MPKHTAFHTLTFVLFLQYRHNPTQDAPFIELYRNTLCNRRVYKRLTLFFPCFSIISLVRTQRTNTYSINFYTLANQVYLYSTPKSIFELEKPKSISWNLSRGELQRVFCATLLRLARRRTQILEYRSLY